MFTVHKQVLKQHDIQWIEVPYKAQVLLAKEQYDQICIWYWCEPSATKEMRRIAIVGTGGLAPDPTDWTWIGTAMIDMGHLVYHIFEANAPGDIVQSAQEAPVTRLLS